MLDKFDTDFVVVQQVIFFDFLIQPVPELPSHKKQACADNKMTKIIFPVAHITELKSFQFHQSISKKSDSKNN
jgi:hypothetical protein